MSEDLRCLTLHQPRASLVALGVKTIETRSWSTKYRGPLAIHAAKRAADQVNLRLMMAYHSAAKRSQPCGKCDHPDSWHACHMTFTRCALCGCDGWTEPPLPLGAVVATCTLVGCVPITRPASETGEIPPDWALIDPGSDRGLRWTEPLTYARHGWQLHHCEDQRPYGDYSPGQYAWLLADIKPLPEPVSAGGRQQLWRPSADLRAEIERQLG